MLCWHLEKHSKASFGFRHNVNMLLSNSTFLILAILVVWYGLCQHHRLFYTESFYIYHLLFYFIYLTINLKVDVSILTVAFELKLGKTSSFECLFKCDFSVLYELKYS